MALSYANAQMQVARIGMSINVIVGNVAGILNLFVFCQKSMRQNSCGTFLIAWSVLTLLYSNYIVLSSALSRGFGIDPSTTYSVYCRIRRYLNGVINVLLICFLIAASVDRVVVSSSNANIRLWSTRRRALRAIIFITIFWMIVLIPNLIFTAIQPVGDGLGYVCNFMPGIPTTVITYYIIICVNLIPLILLAGCGIKTLWNIRSNRVQRPPLLHSKDRTLILLLLLQIMMYIILRSPTAMNYLYSQLTIGRSKTVDQVALDSLLTTVVLFAQFTHVAISPRINFLTRGFREEFQKGVIRLLRIQTIHRDDSSMLRNAQTYRLTLLNRNVVHPTVLNAATAIQC
jgi:uncharacterized membrane protein YagU involved in acid resistance